MSIALSSRPASRPSSSPAAWNTSGFLAEAAKAGVIVISSAHDTATTVFLARGAVRVESMISAELFTFTPDTLLDEARDKASSSRHFVFPIVDENRALVGMLSKSDFLKPIPRELILVDHNELSQAVHGAEKRRGSSKSWIITASAA